MHHSLSVKDIIDILLVASILYGVFRLLRRNGAVNLFWGILTFMLVWFVVSYIFHLELTGALFDRIVEVGALALIVLFQNEIRGFMYTVGARFSKSKLLALFKSKPSSSFSANSYLPQLALACKHLSESKTGALIVITRHQNLRAYSDTGEILNAKVSARLIEQIFYKNTPLHDGALVIDQGIMESAACILPVSQDKELPKQYGLRHRAALGLTEKTDALAIVVSEETGQVAVASGAEMWVVEVDNLMPTIINELNNMN